MLTRFDEDLIPHATLVVCPDGVKRTFLGFDEDGDIRVQAPDLAPGAGYVYFFAGDCKLSEAN